MTIAHGVDGLAQTIRSGKRSIFFRDYWRAFQHRRKRGRIRAELSSFSDTELKDIGLTRGEIDYITLTSSNIARALKRNLDAPCLARLAAGTVKLVSISPVSITSVA